MQLKQEEHQRVLGVMATFNTTRYKDALPLTAGQKYQLFFKSATDPWPFVVAAFGAGIDQADNRAAERKTDGQPEWGNAHGWDYPPVQWEPVRSTCARTAPHRIRFAIAPRRSFAQERGRHPA